MRESLGQKRRRFAEGMFFPLPPGEEEEWRLARAAAREAVALEADLEQLAVLAKAAAREAAELKAAEIRKSELLAERNANSMTVEDVMKASGYERRTAARFMRRHFPFYTVGRRLFIPKWAWELFTTGSESARAELKRARREGLDWDVPTSGLPDLWQKRRRKPAL